MVLDHLGLNANSKKAAGCILFDRVNANVGAMMLDIFLNQTGQTGIWLDGMGQAGIIQLFPKTEPITMGRFSRNKKRNYIFSKTEKRLMDKHIEYLISGDFEDAKERGWNGAGWYFWDEADGQFCYGPYENKQRAKAALNRYAEILYDNFK